MGRAIDRVWDFADLTRVPKPIAVPYPLLCAVAGIAIAWIPAMFHGPIPEKFAYYGISGAVAVWAFYVSRLLIGLWVGMTVWPRPWYVRGPMCGALAMIPPGFFALATPNCGGL